MDEKGAVTQLSEDALVEEGTFKSLQDWFQEVLLAEYAERYLLDSGDQQQ